MSKLIKILTSTLMRKTSREFTYEELEVALNQTAEKKKGGCDGVELAMIKRLPIEGNRHLLNIYTQSWKEGVTPGRWKKAVIVPLLKAGKDPKEKSSFRPVSLTPAMVKIIERMATNRLMCYLKEGERISS